MRVTWLLTLMASILLVTGCVPIPPEQRSQFEESSTTNTSTAGFQGLDPGAIEVASQHFVTKGYGSDHTKQISDLAETIYSRIMTDTGLYTYQPPGRYNLVVYSGKDEYTKKTQQPDWSDGVVANNVLYIADGPQLGPELAHQMSHLIFYQYMGSNRQQDIRWLDEGLAMYEQIQEMTAEGLRSDWRTQWRNALRTQAKPFDQMTALASATERDRLDDLWHEQVGDVVRFMVEQGGRNGMSQFLGSLRDGHPVDDAVHVGFPGIWSKFSDVESAWKLSL